MTFTPAKALITEAGVRPPWKAGLIGGAVALAECGVAIPVVLAFMGSPGGGYAGAAVGQAVLVLIVIGITMLTLSGAAAGMFLLKRRRPWHFALWAIPLGAIGVALPLALIGYGLGRLS